MTYAVSLSDSEMYLVLRALRSFRNSQKELLTAESSLGYSDTTGIAARIEDARNLQNRLDAIYDGIS